MIRSLKEQGTSIIFITHKLGEVLEIADRITVLRRGKAVATVPAAGTSERELAELMVGRPVLLRVEKGAAQPGEPLLTVRDLVVHDSRGLEAVREASFEIRAGEIVGLAGVDGNGQSELVEALTGLVKPTRRQHRRRRPRDSRPRRPGQLRGRRGPHPRGSPAPRPRARLHARREPRAARYPPTARLTLRHAPPARDRRARTAASERVRRARRRARHQARALSGGNQQKVVIAREMSGTRRILIAAQPTRGLDVGAIEFVHQRLVAVRELGAAILLVSFELEEILSLSDRILVMYEGRIVAEHTPDVSKAVLGVEMMGGRSTAAV